MVSRGARHLVLVGRSKPTASAQTILDELRDMGAEVVTAAADVGNEEQVRTVLGTIKTSMPPLRGIVHAAGILDDGTLLKQSLERINAVMAPKAGAWHLHTLTRDASLDFFVLFSSVASTLGSPGQSNYGAANAFLDALVHHRKAHGLPALGINWGPWSEVGLAAADRGRGERLADRGLGSIAPAQGIGVFEQLLRHQADQISVMPFDPTRWCQSYPAVAQSSLLTGFAPPPAGTDTPRGEGTFAPTEASTPPTEAWLISQIQEQAAKVLGLSASRIAPNRRLEAYGLDSLMGVELSHRLSARLGVALPGNIVWQHPTVAQLAAHLTEKAASVPPSYLKSSDRDRSAPTQSEDTRSPLPAGVRVGRDVGQSSKANSQPAHRTSSLVPLKPEGSNPPLFLAPPAAFTVSCYGPLLKHLESDQPVYALQYLGMDGKDQPHERLEDMAAHFKSEILQVQPHGPYLLGGRCLGGVVAFETALQLHDEGHEVAMLALIDVVYPPSLPATRRRAGRPRDAFMPLSDVNNPADRKLSRLLRYCTATLGGYALAGLYLLFLQTVNRTTLGNRHFADLPETQTRAIIETFLAHRRARARYVARVYSGKITLFAAEADNRINRTFKALWKSYTTGGLQRHVVPGSHFTLASEPHVRILGAKLTEAINEALAGRKVSV
jgi:thioesterase domain-containing protein/acyl carrier protein